MVEYNYFYIFYINITPTPVIYDLVFNIKFLYLDAAWFSVEDLLTPTNGHCSGSNLFSMQFSIKFLINGVHRDTGNFSSLTRVPCPNGSCIFVPS